jgi:hypothetical protein
MSDRTRAPIGWRLPSLTLGAIVCVPLLALGCGEDATATPECPDLPLYNLRELIGDAASGEAAAANEKWQAEGNRFPENCVTGAGTATIKDAATTGD